MKIEKYKFNFFLKLVLYIFSSQYEKEQKNTGAFFFNIYIIFFVV